MKDGKLGVALVGLGMYSEGQLAPALQKTVHCFLAGIVTGNVNKMEIWKSKYKMKDGSCYTYRDFAAIKNNPAIDIVYVALPNGLHADAVIAAARAGKHVICEKPMAVTVEECDRMIAARQMEMQDGSIAHCSSSYSEKQNHFRVEAGKGWIQLSPAFAYSGIRGKTSEGELKFRQVFQQALQMDDFALCIKEGRPTTVPGEEGRQDVKILQAIYKAMETGERVIIPDN